MGFEVEAEDALAWFVFEVLVVEGSEEESAFRVVRVEAEEVVVLVAIVTHGDERSKAKTRWPTEYERESREKLKHRTLESWRNFEPLMRKWGTK